MNRDARRHVPAGTRFERVATQVAERLPQHHLVPLHHAEIAADE
jgi:hypothetical protein